MPRKMPLATIPSACRNPLLTKICRLGKSRKQLLKSSIKRGGSRPGLTAHGRIAKDPMSAETEAGECTRGAGLTKSPAAKTGSGIAQCGKVYAESREGTPQSEWKKGKVVAGKP